MICLKPWNAPKQAVGMTGGMMMHKGMMRGMWRGPMDMGGGMGSMQMRGEGLPDRSSPFHGPATSGEKGES